MISTFQPLLVNEGNFKSEFLCWKQGTNNAINNNALAKFKDVLGEVSQSEGEAYTIDFEQNKKWGKLDLNQRPAGYESAALTD